MELLRSRPEEKLIKIRIKTIFLHHSKVFLLIQFFNGFLEKWQNI